MRDPRGGFGAARPTEARRPEGAAELIGPAGSKGRTQLAGPAGSSSPARRLRAAATLAAVVLLPACTPMDNAMHAIFGRSMRDQPSFDPYEAPLLPAEGSVPFAAGNYPAEIGHVMIGQPEGMIADLPPFTPAMMAPPGAPTVNELENPVPPSEASLARGQVMYDRYCTVCHGATGLSADAPILPKLPLMGAYNLANGAAVDFTDGYIYAMIRIGRGMMPAYGHRLTHYDRWNIVNYVRQLQASAPAAGAQPGAGAGQPPGGAGQPGDTAGGAGGEAGDTGGAGGSSSTEGASGVSASRREG